MLIDDRRKYACAARPARTRRCRCVSNRWSTMPTHVLTREQALPLPDQRAVLDRMPGSDVPVIHQTWDAGDPVPFWARFRASGNHLYDLEDDPGEETNLAGSAVETDWRSSCGRRWSSSRPRRPSSSGWALFSPTYVNYRHAFHAGNHPDVFKHAALTLVLERLRQKPRRSWCWTPTPASASTTSAASRRRGRASTKQGAAQGVRAGRASAPGYVELLRAMNGGAWPPIPARRRSCGASARRRPADRLRAAPGRRRGAAGALPRRPAGLGPPPRRLRGGRRAAAAAGAPRPGAHRPALRADRRSPAAGEGAGRGLAAGRRAFIAWYPIKDRRIGDSLAERAKAAAFPKTLQAEFLPFAEDGVRLAGGGLIIATPPGGWTSGWRALGGARRPARRWARPLAVDWLTPQ